jgi:hypothetical protein
MLTIPEGRAGSTSRPRSYFNRRLRGLTQIFWALAFGALALSATGCSAVTAKIRDLREQAATRGTPHVRTFPVDRRAAYAAAVAALPKVGLQFQRGGAAQGELEAIGEQTAEGNGNRRSQLVLTLRLADNLDGGTEVKAWLEEYLETDPRKSSGRATGAPAPDLALYEAFFNALAAGLKK